MEWSKISVRIAAAVIAVFAVTTVQAQENSDSEELRQRFETVLQQRKLLGVYTNLSNLYIDKIDMEPLVERAIKSMLDELDPHSTYIPPEEMSGVREQFSGEFGGIGIEFNVHRDTILVVNVIGGAPADAAGVRPNDRIVEIDGENAIGISRTDVTRKLRGPRGSKVAVGVVRHGAAERLDFEIERGMIPLNTVEASYRIDKETGYIRVRSFGYTTMSEFRKAFDELGGIKSLIVDLRGNGGGIMDQAVQLAGFFLPEGSMVLTTEGDNVKTQQFKSQHKGVFTKGGVVVLIDGRSASASEILAGALQDWDRAVIIGTPSYGKGLVQRQIMLPDSSAVRITIARYHTPTGRVIQRPYEKGKRDEYYKAHRERLNGGAADLPEQDNLPEYKTLRNGRTVYGGGGITPDITIEADTTLVTDCVAKLTAKGLIVDHMYNYLDRSRAELAVEYPSFELFDRDYEVSAELIDGLLAAGAERGIECSEEEREGTEQFIRRFIKGYVARMLFSNNEYWRVLNDTEDEVYRTAVETVHDKARMKSLLGY